MRDNSQTQDNVIGSSGKTSKELFVFSSLNRYGSSGFYTLMKCYFTGIPGKFA